MGGNVKWGKLGGNMKWGKLGGNMKWGKLDRTYGGGGEYIYSPSEKKDTFSTTNSGTKAKVVFFETPCIYRYMYI